MSAVQVGVFFGEGLGRLLDNLVGLGQDHLDVAWV